MSAVLAPPGPPAFVPSAAPSGAGPQPFRWTTGQYRDLGKLSVFRGVRTQLIHGEIYTMAMPSDLHDVCLGKADDWLRTVFAVGHHVRKQMGFDVGTRNAVGPDLAIVVGRREDYLTRKPTTAARVVEVSDSSLFLDTTTKAELYATAGVADYWVLDLDGRRLVVFRDPAPLPAGLGATAYRTHLVYGPADAAAPLAAPGHPVPVADLLP